MPEIETQTLTLKELADYCQCSKIPVTKQVNRLQLSATYKEQHGKKVIAYKLTKLQLDSIYETIQKNKTGGVINNPVTDNTPAVTGQLANADYKTLLDGYIEYRELYAVAQNSVKLLEDRQGGYLQQLKEMQSEKEVLIKDNATLTAEALSIKKTSELYKKCFLWAVFVSAVLLFLVLFSLVLK